MLLPCTAAAAVSTACSCGLCYCGKFQRWSGMMPVAPSAATRLIMQTALQKWISWRYRPACSSSRDRGCPTPHSGLQVSIGTCCQLSHREESSACWGEAPQMSVPWRACLAEGNGKWNAR
jgi:hypothetical protein